jgi:mRNA interferase YafO
MDLFCTEFRRWKSADEYGSYWFGKDSAYVAPAVNGERYILRHVHLVPLADKVQLIKWNQAWKRRGRKTSDRVLVYVGDHRGDVLLIFILPEPDAHAVAAMKTQTHKEIMAGFATVAEAFIADGSIIA